MLPWRHLGLLLIQDIEIHNLTRLWMRTVHSNWIYDIIKSNEKALLKSITDDSSQMIC